MSLSVKKTRHSVTVSAKKRHSCSSTSIIVTHLLNIYHRHRQCGVSRDAGPDVVMHEHGIILSVACLGQRSSGCMYMRETASSLYVLELFVLSLVAR